MKMVLPKHLTDIEAIELIYGPPERRLLESDMRVYQKWMTEKIVELPSLLLGAEMGLGKAQPVDCVVKTPNGDREIGSLSIGDEIFASGGTVQRVTGVFPQGSKKTFLVRFRDGSETRCNEEHLWQARAGSARDRSWKVYTLRQMMGRGITRKTPAGNSNNRWEIPLCGPVQYPEKKLPLDPYAFGALLGDGCFRSGAVLATAGEDKHIRNGVKAAWPENTERRKADGVYEIRLKGLRPVLECLGLYGARSADKFIPEDYQTGSEAQRRALLAGLMDTDGFCNTRGSASFSSKSEKLARDIRELVMSLGGTARISSYDRAEEGKGVEFRVSVKMNENPFTLERKASRWVQPKGQCRVQRRIASVESVGETEQVCISVSSPDKLYLTDDFIVTHNTGAVLKAIVELINAGTVKRILIVAPLKVAEETWPEEIAKWDFSRHLTYRIVTGTLEERTASLKYGPVQITIVNRENFLWLRKYIGVARWSFDMIVYDEASRLKGGKIRTTPKARTDGTIPDDRLTELGVIQSIRQRTKKIVELSGTPSPNGLIDLWGPIYALDGGKRLGLKKTQFEFRWFRENKYTKRKEPFDHSEREIMAAIKDVFFSLREEDYLTLPPLIPVDHFVTLTPGQMKQYRDFEREMAMDVKNRAGEKEVIAAVNNGVLTGKLLQFANGSLYLGDKFDEETGGRLPKESVKVHDHKLDVLESIMEEAGGKPVLVAYSFKFDMDAIRKRFPYVRVYGESSHDKRDWDAGKIRMLLTHPASAGHGLNLQFGSNIMVWYGLTYSLELYRQFIKRLHRSGQKADRVFLHRIMARGTVDEDIMPNLREKGTMQDRISDAVRVRLRKAA